MYQPQSLVLAQSQKNNHNNMVSNVIDKNNLVNKLLIAFLAFALVAIFFLLNNPATKVDLEFKGSKSNVELKVHKEATENK